MVDSFWSKKYWTKHRTSTTDMAKELKLVLKKKWYDMIASGEKKEEYREVKEYWMRYFGLIQFAIPGECPLTSCVIQGQYDIVTFYLGYTPDRPSMSFKIKEIDIGTGKEEWGAEPGKEYYVIKLGERI